MVPLQRFITMRQSISWLKRVTIIFYKFNRHCNFSFRSERMVEYLTEISYMHRAKVAKVSAYVSCLSYRERWKLSFDWLAKPVASSNQEGAMQFDTLVIDSAVYLFSYFFQFRNGRPTQKVRSIRVMRDSYANSIRHLKSIPRRRWKNRSLPCNTAANLRDTFRTERNGRKRGKRVFENCTLLREFPTTRNGRLGK